MKALSVSAIRDYRKNSKRHNYLDIEVLKARINSYIEASEHVYPVLFGTIYQFGSCKIKVDGNNIITSIKYTDTPVKATEEEAKKMSKCFYKYGLDKNGIEFRKNKKRTAPN